MTWTPVDSVDLPDEMRRRLRQDVEDALTSGVLTLAECNWLRRFLDEILHGYTYL